MAEETKTPPAEAPAPSVPPKPPETAPPLPAEAEPAEDWETRFKYLLADFENFRRRNAREQERSRTGAKADLLRALLPLHEAFARAREAVRRHPANDPVRRGVELLVEEWEGFLTAEGVEPIARAGQPFRAEEHEAVGEAPVTPAHPEGSVVDIVQQGYRFPGGLLRLAKVVVARRPAAQSGGSVARPAEPSGEDSSG